MVVMKEDMSAKDIWIAAFQTVSWGTNQVPKTSWWDFTLRMDPSWIQRGSRLSLAARTACQAKLRKKVINETRLVEPAAPVFTLVDTESLDRITKKILGVLWSRALRYIFRFPQCTVRAP